MFTARRRLMNNCSKYFGIPGSGKTEKLLSLIENEVEHGTPIFDICYVTFSRSASLDAQRRIKNRFEEKQDLHYFSTIHGVCRRLLAEDNPEWDIKKEKAGKKKNEDTSMENRLRLENSQTRHDFLELYGLDYPITTWADDDIPETTLMAEDAIQQTDEEKLFTVMNYCKQRCIPIDDWWTSEIQFKTLDTDLVIPICEDWEIYKKEHNIVDFTDMLLHAKKEKLYPPVSLLVVDEFQDLTPLTYNIIMGWKKHIKTQKVGGDDDQTLYTWAGANPSFLLNLPAEEHILSTSHRVPIEILEQARSLIETIDNRRYKEYNSTHLGGEFIYLPSARIQDIIPHIEPNKNIFFLFRTNYLAYLFHQNLIRNGIPFSMIRKKKDGKIPNIWTAKLTELRDAVIKLQNGQPLKHIEVYRLKEILPSCSPGKLDGYVYYGKKTWFEKQKQDLWGKEELLRKLFVKIPAWNSKLILTNIRNDTQRTAYLHNIGNNNQHLSPWDIKIGTIHSAKGLEADIVFLFNNHTSRIEQAILNEGQSFIDAEKRVYYVGMTRAKEKLVIADNFFFNKYKFDLGL